MTMRTLCCTCANRCAWRRRLRLHDEETVPSDVGREDRDRLRDEAMRLFKRRCLTLLVALAATAALVCFVTWWTWDTAGGDALRPSDAVRRLHSDVPSRVRLFLWNWMLFHPTRPCVVTAPHLRVYKNYAILRIQSLPVPVANAAWKPVDADTHTETVREDSLMCNGQQRGVLRKRHRTILFSYDSGDAGTAPMSIVLSGADAHCAQHMVDLMNGEWPCPLDSPDVLDALRLPCLPVEWTYGNDGAIWPMREETAGPSPH